MLNLRNISIRRKLTLIIMAASTGGLLLISASFIAYELITFRHSMTHDLSTLAEIIGNQSTAAITYDDRASGKEILSSLTAKQRVIAAAIYKGNALFASYTQDSADKKRLVPAHPAFEGARFEQENLVLFHPIQLAGETIGTIYLRSNLDEMQERMWRYAGIILLFVACALVVTYALSSLLQRIISEPMFHLIETARKVSLEKNFAIRATRNAEDELGHLIDGFNEMLGEVQKKDAALQQANDKLEKRVQERTLDLQLEIAERKKAERALQELHSELERAYNELRQTQLTVMQHERLKALGQMASGIAHDINNALSPVIGFTDLLARSEPGLSENGKKYLQFIKLAGEDVAKIVARLREFYRRRGTREALSAVNLNATAQQVIEMTRPRWRDIPQGNGLMIELETDFAAGLPDLAGNETEVREALTNLILNAVDALPKGGRIVVRTRSTRRNVPAFPETHQPTHLVMEVSDTGIGMDEPTRKQCLEPFFSTKGKRGTGLGLAMVYGIMERHEGEIEIESQPRKGTTVRLIFPLRKGAPGGQPARAGNAHRDPLQILCIDDEPLLRQLLKDLLEADGHCVQVTDGGEAGLNSFRSARERGKPFDVVITDLGMPYVDGRQVARTLKRESPATPVILLTGWGPWVKDDGETPAQVDGVLSKPPRVSELRETISRVIAVN